MNKTQGFVLKTLVTAQRFLDANASALGPVNATGARKALDDAIAAVGRHAISQVEHDIGSTGETKRQRGIRLSMHRRYLQPIAKIAAATLSQPEMATLRLPRFGIVGLELVQAATGIANAAEPHAAAFVAAGLPPNFLEGLRGEIHDLHASLGGRTDHATVRHSSTAALRAETRNARRVLQMLDAVMQLLVSDEELLDAWAIVRRIPRKPGPTRGAQQDGNTGSTGTTTSAPSLTAPTAATQPAAA